MPSASARPSPGVAARRRCRTVPLPSPRRMGIVERKDGGQSGRIASVEPRYDKEPYLRLRRSGRDEGGLHRARLRRSSPGRGGPGCRRGRRSLPSLGLRRVPGGRGRHLPRGTRAGNPNQGRPQCRRSGGGRRGRDPVRPRRLHGLRRCAGSAPVQDPAQSRFCCTRSSPSRFTTTDLSPGRRPAPLRPRCGPSNPRGRHGPLRSVGRVGCGRR